MTLGTKIAAAISLVFVVVLGGATTLVVLDELEFAEREIDIHGRLLGKVVASVAGETWEERGEAAAHALVREIDRHEEKIEIRWLDVTSGDFPPSHLAVLTEQVRRRLAAGETVGQLSPRDENTMYTFVPVLTDGEPMRVIQIAESLEVRNAHVQRMVERIAGGFGMAFLLSGLAAYSLGQWLVSRPVAQLIAVARRVGSGDFSARAAGHMRDELGHLAHETNLMAVNLARARRRLRDEEESRCRIEERLRHADRLATLGQLASGVAHEVGTPLQAIGLQADVLERKAGNVEGVGESVRGIKRQVHRIAKIVENLLRFARKETPRREPRDLREVVENALSLIETAGARDGIEIDPRLGRHPATAAVDGEQIEQVIANLVLNGIQAMPDGGRITVGLECPVAFPRSNDGRLSRDHIRLYVEDEGTGISDEVRAHLFDPFFTTKPVDQGTGLGLSITYGIVREHEGWIEVDSEPARGSRFSVFLPAIVEEPSFLSTRDA